MLPDSPLDGFKGMRSSLFLDGLEFDLSYGRAGLKSDFYTDLFIPFEQAQTAVFHTVHPRPRKQSIRTGRNPGNGESQVGVGYPLKDLPRILVERNDLGFRRISVPTVHRTLDCEGGTLKLRRDGDGGLAGDKGEA